MMPSVFQIEELIVQSSEGFFDEPNLRMSLHVTIRIALDFHEFVLGASDPPSREDAVYVMDTIRSGIDECFALAYSCRMINIVSDAWNLGDNFLHNFSALRAVFLERLADLLAAKTPIKERLVALLAMVRLELTFLAQYFPWLLTN